MAEYLVRWEVHLDCDSPREAAREALEIQRDPESEAQFFQVYETNNELDPVGEPIIVDLWFEENNDEYE